MSTPPVTDDFLADVKAEAEFQTSKWGDDHDAAKSDEDWFWTLGWLVGKAVRPGTSTLKKRHRLRAAAALLMKWDEHVARRRSCDDDSCVDPVCLLDHAQETP